MDNERIVRDTVPEYHSANPVIRRLFTARLDLALELGRLDAPGPLEVLDLGCGGGLLLDMMTRRHPAHLYWGWDAHEDVLRLPVKGVKLERVDLMGALPAKTFDRVFCLDVLEHFPDLQPVLARIRPLLKPGGLLILSEPTESALYKLGRLLAKGTTSVMEGPTGTPHYFDAAGVHREVLKAGFASRGVRRVPPWPVDLFHVTSYERTP